MFSSQAQSSSTTIDPLYQLKTSSQFLAQMQPWPFPKYYSPFGSKNHPINLKTLEKLLAETAYFIFYLSFNEISCYLSKGLWTKGKKEEEQQLKIIMITTEQAKRKEDIALQKFIDKECKLVPGLNEQSYLNAIQDYIELCLEGYRESRVKGLILPTRINEAIIKTQIDEFCYVYFSIIKPKISLFSHPGTLVRALQETRLFRENAILLKFSNHSILAKIVPLKMCRDDLKLLIDEFEQERASFLKQPKARINHSEEKLQNLFRMFCHSSVLTLNASISENQQGNEPKNIQAKNTKIGKILNEKQIQNRAIVLSFNVEELPYQFLTQQRLDYLLTHPDQQRLPEDKRSNNKRINQFELRYYTLSNQIQLKVFTNQIVRQQEIDLTAAVLASLTSTLGEVDYCFEQNSRKIKTNDKCVVLRTRVQLHSKECPFMAILEGVDRLIAHSLLIEHDLRIKRQADQRHRVRIGEMLMYLLKRVKNMLEILTEKLP